MGAWPEPSVGLASVLPGPDFLRDHRGLGSGERSPGAYGKRWQLHRGVGFLGGGWIPAPLIPDLLGRRDLSGAVKIVTGVFAELGIED